MSAIPRPLVAEALGLPPETDALPEGDLPVERFAARFLAALETGDEDETDAWTVDLMHHLTGAAPDLALDAILSCRDMAPDSARSLGDGPLHALITRSGAAVIDRVETRAAEDATFAKALGRIPRDEIEHPFLRARLEAAAR